MTDKKVAIVTGAGKGMGAAIARELCNKHYELVLFSPSGATELAQELKAVSIKGSVTSNEDLTLLISKTINEFGRIDAVVNSTGHPAQGAIIDITDTDWVAGMELVFLNVVRLARLITPHFLKQGKGAIVNISTFAAIEPEANYPISSTMRAALASYVKLYADAYAKYGIRMNNLLPGFIESYEIDNLTREKIPMRRAGKLEEIAKTAVFLLSEGAGYITGQNIRVDGGLTRSL
ncbi:MAG: hypothetical protein A3E87_03610 [Gammaproteobacteria bacterium RIFCSPHIGHO2_12_FULL_35_23]|nr:MAG: hypothetical protein A3E87_03610 [Gammaproteobacteria bacterium RIFCSPHIGHO2_12_FULL_35_23]